MERTGNEEISIQPRVGLVFEDWLTGWIYVVSGQAEHLEGHISQFADMAPWIGMAPS